MDILHDFKIIIWGIAVDAEDNIFVANFGNSIDKVSLNNGKSSIIQSTKTSSRPLGLAINSKNEIYIATYNGGEIMKMTKEGIISNIAGDGKEGFADGIGKSARIGLVEGICFDEKDIAYFCDYYTNHSAIRKITPEGKITTICGEERGNSDGKGKQAEFDCPSGIVYNYSTKLFYITDYNNKSIRTMTVDGNVNTLCKYSDQLRAIAIDGGGKLYVSTVKDSSTGEGELITVDSKGEIKQMNISVKDCGGLAFNSKGDLFFTSNKKLCVIRNCTKYPPHPILAATNINTKEPQIDVQELKKQLGDAEAKLINTQAQLSTSQNEIQELRKKFTTIEGLLATSEIEKQRLLDNLKKLETQNKSLEQKETKEQTGDELLKWLTSIKLANLLPILQDLGVKDVEFLKLVQENDLDGLNIKLIEKRMLFQAIKKLKEDSAIRVLQNDVSL